ncbi:MULTISPECIES: hypothetical protein [Limibacillus]|uniref:Uncharacterized protein n=1 Tax=Limibacillus halophilus TaxID=1579333 RepID=A0A839STW8_9PROT|nr:hypothetical protein [Limibacillus halophilus]MBB3065429.1 hypothetical protein [Limibacillus halophilus]
MADQASNSLDLFGGEAPDANAPAPADTWVLDLGDLIADAQGEIVVAETAGAHLTITASASISATGLAEAHTTSAGFDVDGYNFVRFDNGITLYYEDGMDLSLLAQHGTTG